MPEEELSRYGIATNKRELERERRLEEGDMRWQKAEKRYEQFKELNVQGLKRKKIAEELGVSIDTIKKYRKRLKDEIEHHT